MSFLWFYSEAVFRKRNVLLEEPEGLVPSGFYLYATLAGDLKGRNRHVPDMRRNGR